MKAKKKIYLQKKKRYLSSIFGTIEKPRLSVFRSNKHIYGQLIDDLNGQTLAFASTLEKTIFEKGKDLKKTQKANLVGQLLAQKSKEVNVTKIVFDRGNRRYIGRIKSLSEGARENGLLF